MTEGSTAPKLSDKFTYADYLTWPDDERWEVIHGHAYDKNCSPGPRHQRIVVELITQVMDALKGKSCEPFLGPLDIRLPKHSKTDDINIDTVVQPDILVICDENKIDDRGCVGPPDLIIEILSEDTAGRDEKTKFQLYEEQGVREYWIINPWDNTVRIYNLDQRGKYGFPRLLTKLETADSQAIEGLSVDLSDVFPDE